MQGPLYTYLGTSTYLDTYVLYHTSVRASAIGISSGQHTQGRWQYASYIYAVSELREGGVGLGGSLAAFTAVSMGTA